jgi:ABC-type amino acid transport substrate-binding protein
VVGIKTTGPFAYRGIDGRWRGISIDLWRNIAETLELQYTFREVDLAGMLEGLQNKSLDVVVGALTVTQTREQAFDFTHPFHSSGLGIAIVPSGSGDLLSLLGRIFTGSFLKLILALIAILFFVGAVLWIFERNRNRSQFGGNAAEGLGAAFWWSAVTMTTVGYGDKSPQSLGGRIVGVLWMFSSILLISVFTAAVASALTVSSLESPVHSPEDLRKVRVGTVPSSTSAEFLKKEGIPFDAYETPEAALRDLAQRDLDAVVYDEPILRYVVQKNRYKNLRVLYQTFERQDYAFGLQARSSLREPINRVLIERVTSAWWKEILYTYMGQ